LEVIGDVGVMVGFCCGCSFTFFRLFFIYFIEQSSKKKSESLLFLVERLAIFGGSTFDVFLDGFSVAERSSSTKSI
jgi:hypothetical protein